MNTMTETAHLRESLALTDDERQPCEVWTRVMGYHRPVASFNIGKKGEHYERRFFREQPKAARVRDTMSCGQVPAERA